MRVLVLCPSLWDEQALATIGHDDEIVYDARDIYEDLSVLEDPAFDVFAYARAIADRHRDVDGVIGTGDYPGSLVAPLVATLLGRPTPTLESVLRLSHKYYSRELQARFVPEATPSFRAFDPAHPPKLDFPVFIKPIKGTMSIDARLVRDEKQLREGLANRQKQTRLGLFRALLAHAGLDTVPVEHFIAEAPLQGTQVTVDGFVERGRATIMGIVDSVMYPGTISFERFEYPSRLSKEVQDRMARIATALMEGAGFDQSCFNIEMFYDPELDREFVIEVNPRMAYQFSDLYQRVDGTHTHSIQLALATNRLAPWKRGQGKDGASASFVMRTFEDRVVDRAPTDDEIARVAARFPGTIVKPMCRTGDRLSQHDQDVGSYRYCIINMGARDRATLEAHYQEAKEMLPFTLSAK